MSRPSNSSRRSGSSRPAGRGGRSSGSASAASRRPAVPRAAVPRPRGSRSLAQTRTSPISAIGGIAVVAVILLIGLGYGYATHPKTATVANTAVKQLPVESASAVCQAITGSGSDSFTTLSQYSPGSGAPAGPKDTVTTGYLDGTPAPLAKVGAPGTRTEPQPIDVPHTQVTSYSEIPWSVPFVAQAAGAYAPGFSIGEVVRSDSGHQRGLAAQTCPTPGTDFWFQGVALGPDRSSTLHLANADNAPATVNLSLIGPDGPVPTGTGGQNIQLPPNTFEEFLLNLLPSDKATAPTLAALRVTTQVGRVAASVFDADQPLNGAPNGNGMDFIPAQAPNQPEQTVQVIPGITAGLHQRIDLMLTATGNQDTSIDKIEWIAGSTFTPAAPADDPVSGDHKLTQPLTVAKGKTIAVDLRKIPDPKESGAIRITSSGGPVLAGIRTVTAATSGQATDSAFLAPAPGLTPGQQAIEADNKSAGKAASYLVLTAVGTKGATVKVTTVGAQGAPAVDTVQVPAGQSTLYPLKPPPGSNEFTTIVEPQPGSDPVYGARAFTDQPAGTYVITVENLTPARVTAAVPPVAADLSGAVSR